MGARCCKGSKAVEAPKSDKKVTEGTLLPAPGAAPQGEDKARMAEMFTALTAGYLKIAASLPPMYNETATPIVEYLKDKPAARVLDVGSGHGEPSLTISKMVPESTFFVCTDNAAGMVEQAKSRFGATPNVEFKLVSGEDLSQFEEGSFDVVILSLVLMFVPDRAQTMKEVQRVLKPGGRAYITCWKAMKLMGPDGFVKEGFVKYLAKTGASQPPPGPNPMACSADNCVEDLVKDAGLTLLPGDLRKPITFDLGAEDDPVMWTMFSVAMGVKKQEESGEIPNAIQEFTACCKEVLRERGHLADGQVKIPDNVFQLLSCEKETVQATAASAPAPQGEDKAAAAAAAQGEDKAAAAAPAPQGEDKARMAEMFTALTAGYLKIAASLPPMYDETASPIVNFLKDKPAARVLDVGSGHGEPSLTISKMVPESVFFVCTDNAAGMVEQAKSRFGATPNVEFKLVSGEDLSQFEEGSFDVVILSLVLMFVPDRAQTMKEVQRVLKPGGRAYITCWKAMKLMGPDGFVKEGFVKYLTKTGASQPPPGPNPMACSADNCVEDLVKDAGLTLLPGDSRKPIVFDLGAEDDPVMWTMFSVAMGVKKQEESGEIPNAIQEFTACCKEVLRERGHMADGQVKIPDNVFQLLSCEKETVQVTAAAAAPQGEDKAPAPGGCFSYCSATEAQNEVVVQN